MRDVAVDSDGALVDLPHVAGIIKGNLCPPPIFPRPFTLVPLLSLSISNRSTSVSSSPLTPFLGVFSVAVSIDLST